MAAQSHLRVYKGSDANLLQQANLNRNLMADKLDAFTAEDATINAAFLADYEADIAAAEEQSSDSTVRAIVGQKTEGVAAALKSAAALMRQVRYYVREAFPTDPAIHYAFGLREWEKVRRSQVKVMQFLGTLHAVAEDHADALAAVGFGPDRIAGILTVRAAVEEADGVQEVHKDGRPVLTAERIRRYNAVYARIMRVNALARIVFAGDYAVKKQFVFSAGRGRRKKSE